MDHNKAPCYLKPEWRLESNVIRLDENNDECIEILTKSITLAAAK